MSTTPSQPESTGQTPESERQNIIRLNAYLEAQDQDHEATCAVSRSRVEEIVQLRQQIDTLQTQQSESALADHDAAIKATAGTPYYSGNLRVSVKFLGEATREATEVAQEVLAVIQAIFTGRHLIGNVYTGPGIRGCDKGQELHSVLSAIHDRYLYKVNPEGDSPLEELIANLTQGTTLLKKDEGTPSGSGRPLTGDPGTC